MTYLLKAAGFGALGLFAGAAFTIIYIVIFLLAGAIEAADGQEIGPLMASAVYLRGGLIGGLLVGSFHFLLRWRVGHAILGILGVAPWYVFSGQLYYGEQSGSFESVSGTIVMAILCGGGVGLYLGQKYSQRAGEVECSAAE